LRLARAHSEISPWSIWITYSPDRIHWGSADKVMCAGTAVLDELVDLCLTSSRPAM
jgi:hypothetical protein